MQKQQHLLFLFIILIGFTSCSNERRAQKIIDQSITFYGMDKLNQRTVDFDFRQYHFTLKFDGGNFFYQRTFTDDSLGKVKDQLSNHGFVREVNGFLVPQTAKDSSKFAAAVNSVAYFILLPLKLNDPGVQKKYLRYLMVNGKMYDEIEVTFSKDNGGKDYDDTFYFWFDQVDHSMDYLAYRTGGIRFRAVRTINQSGDLKLQDYDNLTSKPGTKTPLKDYGKLFEEDKLIKLSQIEINHLKVH
ncbi:MAG: hypothetical protein IE931_08845 [Sphingobacteriales bacterium]|nr:hypothetical protein [Sphingobacteriales bacterium]